MTRAPRLRQRLGLRLRSSSRGIRRWEVIVGVCGSVRHIVCRYREGKYLYQEYKPDVASENEVEFYPSIVQ